MKMSSRRKEEHNAYLEKHPELRQERRSVFKVFKVFTYFL